METICVGHVWPVYCGYCEGAGRLTILQISHWCGVSIPTVKRLLAGRPVRPTTLYRVIDNLEKWAKVTHEWS